MNNMMTSVNKWIFFALISLVTGQFSENDIPEIGYVDSGVDPCEDFYQFTCGNFKNIYPTPGPNGLIDNFYLLDQELLQIGNEILSSQIDPLNDPIALKKVKSAYGACTDTLRLSTIVAPELQIVAEVGGMPILDPTAPTQPINWTQIGELVGLTGIPIFFSYLPKQFNIFDYIIIMQKDNTQLPSSASLSSFPTLHKSYDEILMEEMENAKNQHRGKDGMIYEHQNDPLRKLFRNITNNLLVHGAPQGRHEEDVERDIDDVMEFLILSDGIVEDDAEILPLDMQFSIKDLQKWTQDQFKGEVDINWLEYFQGVFKRSGMTVTDDLEISTFPPPEGAKLIYGILNLIKKSNPQTVKNYILLRLFIFLAPDSDASTKAAFETYITSLGYEITPNWEYCTRKLLDKTGTGIGLNYAVLFQLQNYHFNQNKLVQALDMLETLKSTIKSSILSSAWMDAETIAPAIRKIENMLNVVGWPDFVYNATELDAFYENVKICKWDHYGNSKTIRAYQKAYDLSQFVLEKRDFWTVSGFEVNAFYSTNANRIILPISMLYDIFFNGSNPVQDFSRLGTVISHEITHGFDSNGKNFDENGAFGNWWTNATSKTYAQKAQCYTDQYSKFYLPEIDRYVNGKKTLNENIADNGGLNQAFIAFRKYVEEKKLVSTSAKYSLEQLFFISFGTMWCNNETDDYLLKIVENDHSPARFRVEGMASNSYEFAKAFSCPSGSRMNPKEKCVLW